MTETLANEGDDDAIYVMDFENAAAEVLQNDEELAKAYTSYVEARRKLSEKFRPRGFWPVGNGKMQRQRTARQVQIQDTMESKNPATKNP